MPFKTDVDGQSQSGSYPALKMDEFGKGSPGILFFYVLGENVYTCVGMDIAGVKFFSGYRGKKRPVLGVK